MSINEFLAGLFYFLVMPLGLTAWVLMLTGIVLSVVRSFGKG